MQIDLKTFFKDAVSDEGLNIILQQQVPAEPYKGHHNQDKYFRSAELIVPVQGTTFEEIVFQRRSSHTVLSACDVITPVQFPHLPAEIEIFDHNKKDFPATRVRTSNGEFWWVSETVKEIIAKIAETRSTKLETGMKALADQMMKNILG
ncbi:MAG TPA: hypothetical protein DCM27_03350 [Rhodospirillaceae bacterium]|nr:hypothetical protein [Rhodospirillaceae bacterium]